MRTYDSPYIADWFVISLRWISLAGLLVSLGLDGGLNLAVTWPLIALIFWNVGMTYIAAANWRMVWHRQIGLGVDVVFASIFFFLQGGLAGPAQWVPILPILTAAVYFEFVGTMIVAVLFSLLQYGSRWLDTRVLMPDMPLVASIGITLVLGALFGILGDKMADHLRVAREKRLRDQERKWHIESERLRAIYELTSTLTATLSYKRVLDSALDMGYTALNPEPD